MKKLAKKEVKNTPKNEKTKKIQFNKNTLITIGIVVVSLIAILVGYFLIGGKEDVAKPKEESKPVVNEVEEPKELQIVNLESTSRPYAVMVENSSTARPYHSGLQDAYIIYEIIVEGGISRYLALFRDVDTARIAGIRSARHYYLDYAMENDAYFIHWGASTQARSDLNILNIDSYEVYHNKYAFYDYSLPVANENSTFTTMSELKDAIATTSYRSSLEGGLLLDYSVESVKLEEDSKVANNVSIYYSSSNVSGFTYNEETKTYMHSVNNKSHNDYVTGEQYNFKNIITYKVTNYTLDDPENKGRQGLENVGSGTGYYITEGFAVSIKWSKSSREAQTEYTLADGTPLIVNDGNTYIAIQPTGQTLNIGE